MGCVSSKKKLSKADLQFLQENTEFTKEQIVEWYEGFIVSNSSVTSAPERANLLLVKRSTSNAFCRFYVFSTRFLCVKVQR